MPGDHKYEKFPHRDRGGQSGVGRCRSQGESVFSNASRRLSPAKLKTVHDMEVNSDLSEITSVQ